MAGKDELKDGLKRRRGDQLTGWQDTLGTEGVTEERQLQKRTYTIYADQHERLIALADESGGKLNDYFRTVLDFLLDDLEAGRVEVEFKTTVKRIK